MKIREISAERSHLKKNQNGNVRDKKCNAWNEDFILWA